MKRLCSIFIFLLMVLTVLGQAPTQINYQGIARNPGGNVFPNQSMTIRLKIHDGSAAGAVRAVTRLLGRGWRRHGLPLPGAPRFRPW